MSLCLGHADVCGLPSVARRAGHPRQTASRDRGAFVTAAPGTPGHGAAASALGYQYQTWWGLLHLLRRGPDMPDARLSLELYDDVAWDAEGSPTELLQLKHHLSSAAAITDMSSDLWRSLAVWLDEASPQDPNGPLLLLVTTAVAPPGSAVHALRPASRSETVALTKLEAAARDSTTVSTTATRTRFLGLEPLDRQTFVSRISVVDGEVPIEGVDAHVRRELMWALPRGHEDLFMRILWGWWDGEALALLVGRRGSVGVGEVVDQINEIRDQFTKDRLPTLVDLIDVDAAELLSLHEDRTFVQQLRLIEWPAYNLQAAVVDYYRAYVHTTRWVDDDLIGLHELFRFDVELVDEWKREFEFMKVDLGASASQDEMKAAGVALLRRLLAATTVRVRSRYDEPFFSRGKRHELADRQEVGWHPEFEAALQALTGP